MKRTLTTALFLLAAHSAAFANPTVPNCWRADNPKRDIQDGVYLVKFTTKDYSATKFGQLLGQLNGVAMKKRDVGSALDGAVIEINFQAPLVTDWRSSAAYPTFAALQKAAMASLEPALKFDGVTISCADEVHAQPR